MKIATVKLQSVTAYSQSKHIDEPKRQGELDRDWEKRCWRQRCHGNKDGYIEIPPMAFMNCIKDAAQYLSMKIPGKGQQTFTKNFNSGVNVTEPINLPIRKDDVEGEWLFVPSDGKRGGGKRVMKCFPLIHEWSGTVVFYILDDVITREVFCKALYTAGLLIGIGRFRPQKLGYYGRFKFEDDELEWTED